MKKGNSSLEITGFTDLNEALFKFTKGDLVQTFGVSLRYWAAKQTKNPANGGPPDGFAEGAYLLFPSKLHSDPYSRISSDVAYEQGKIIEQWTIKYFDSEKQEYAMLKVRFSPNFKDVIEFDVELS